MQLCRIIYCSLAALHVSSYIFSHHQKHLMYIYSFWCYTRESLPVDFMGELELSVPTLLWNRVQMILCAMLCSIAHSIICTRLFRGKMHSDWFNGIEILQGRWQHGEKVGYCYPSGLEKTLRKWDTYVPLVTKGLTNNSPQHVRPQTVT